MKYLASSICACGHAGEQLGNAEGGKQEEHGHAGEQLRDPDASVCLKTFSLQYLLLVILTLSPSNSEI